MAAFGTPDTGGADDNVTTCNTDLPSAIVPTGSRAACVSDVGAYDMVGNVFEWTADWMQGPLNPWAPTGGTATSGATYGNDRLEGVNRALDQGIFGAQNFPAALVRGGETSLGIGSGVFTLQAIVGPGKTGSDLGFRCVRPW